MTDRQHAISTAPFISALDVGSLIQTRNTIYEMAQKTDKARRRVALLSEAFAKPEHGLLIQQADSTMFETVGHLNRVCCLLHELEALVCGYTPEEVAAERRRLGLPID